MDDKINIFYRNVAKNVKNLRLRNNKTQLDIAYNALDYNNDSFYSQLESSTNNKHFNLKQLYLISKYLNCSVKEFFDE